LPPGLRPRDRINVGQNKPKLTPIVTMGVGKIFSRGGKSGLFQAQSKTSFSREAKSGKISFYPVETKKMTFFGKNLIGKYQIPGGASPPFRRP